VECLVREDDGGVKIDSLTFEFQTPLGITRTKMAFNSYPQTPAELADLRAAISKYILPGFAPPAPILDRHANIFSIGSCFAETIHQALERAGVNSHHLFLAETLNTPPCALLAIQKLRGKDTSTLGHLSEKLLKQDRIALLRSYLPQVSAFILTLGVALQPFHEDGLPILQITKSTIGDFRKWRTDGDSWHMLSVDEVFNYVRQTIEGMRDLRPDAPIILTLSPVPLLNATHPSVMVQDCISKSILRAAIAKVMDEEIPNVHYWPSFEIVRWLGGHVGTFFEKDNRHVTPEIIDVITGLFIEKFFTPLGA